MLTALVRVLLPFAALLLGPVLAAAAQDDEVVSEFRKYFKKYTDTATRVEAILALEGAESAGVVDVLLPVLGDPDPEVVRAAVRVLAGFKTRPPVDALFLALTTNKEEGARAGILRVVVEGGYGGANEIVLPLLEDKSWEVRRRAVLALAASRDPAVAAPIAALVSDKEPAVRCAAFEALAQLRSELVLAPAVAALTDESWQVRGSAATAGASTSSERSCARSRRSAASSTTRPAPSPPTGSRRPAARSSS